MNITILYIIYISPLKTLIICLTNTVCSLEAGRLVRLAIIEFVKWLPATPSFVRLVDYEQHFEICLFIEKIKYDIDNSLNEYRNLNDLIEPIYIIPMRNTCEAR